MIDDEPGLNLFTLGQLAERFGIEADYYGLPSDPGELQFVVEHLVRHQHSTVVRALRSQHSDAELFGGLWKTNESRPILDDLDEDSEGKEVEPGWIADYYDTPRSYGAYAWIEEGLPIE